MPDTRVRRETLLQELASVKPGLTAQEEIEQSDCFAFRGGKVYTFNDEILCSMETVFPFEGAVKAGPLLAILERFTEEFIDIQSPDGNEIKIRAGRKRAGITTQSETLLPIDMIEKPGEWWDLPDDFSDALQIVQHCAGKAKSGDKLSCIHLHPERLEAADGFQLIRYPIDLDSEEPILLQATAIRHLAFLAMTEIAITANWAHFRNTEGLTFSCRQWSDDFIDLEPMLSVKGEPLTLPRDLKEAAKTAEIFSSENQDENVVILSFRDNLLKIMGRGQSGWFSETKNTTYKGEPLTFTLSPQILGEISEKYNECEISKWFLKVDTGKYVYMTCIGGLEE